MLLDQKEAIDKLKRYAASRDWWICPIFDEQTARVSARLEEAFYSGEASRDFELLMGLGPPWCPFGGIAFARKTRLSPEALGKFLRGLGAQVPRNMTGEQDVLLFSGDYRVMEWLAMLVEDREAPLMMGRWQSHATSEGLISLQRKGPFGIEHWYDWRRQMAHLCRKHPEELARLASWKARDRAENEPLFGALSLIVERLELTIWSHHDFVAISQAADPFIGSPLAKELLPWQPQAWTWDEMLKVPDDLVSVMDLEGPHIIQFLVMFPTLRTWEANATEPKGLAYGYVLEPMVEGEQPSIERVMPRFRFLAPLRTDEPMLPDQAVVAAGLAFLAGEEAEVGDYPVKRTTRRRFEREKRPLPVVRTARRREVAVS